MVQLLVPAATLNDLSISVSVLPWRKTLAATDLFEARSRPSPISASTSPMVRPGQYRRDYVQAIDTGCTLQRFSPTCFLLLFSATVCCCSSLPFVDSLSRWS